MDVQESFGRAYLLVAHPICQSSRISFSPAYCQSRFASIVNVNIRFPIVTLGQIQTLTCILSIQSSMNFRVPEQGHIRASVRPYWALYIGKDISRSERIESYRLKGGFQTCQRCGQSQRVLACGWISSKFKPALPGFFLGRH